MFLPSRACALALLAALPAARCLAVEDAPPVNAQQMLQDLKSIGDTQTTSLKSRKQTAYQAAMAAAANPAQAVQLWEDAVRAMQFQGLSHDSAQFREWKNGEGEALKDKQVQYALHLYFTWLALTIQRSNGASNHDLLTPVLNYAHEAASDQTTMDALTESIKREKDALKEPPGVPKRNMPALAKKEKNNDENVKRMHDSIMNQSVSGSVYAQYMKISDIVGDIAPPKKARNQQGQATPNETGWEPTPGNVDGIYQQIILPELRAMRDPRVIEYWDFKLRREAEIATANKLASDSAKFNESRRPQLMWSRAEEWAQIGLKNRAASEMFAIIKGNPTLPETSGWIAELTGLLSGSAAPAVPTAPMSAAVPTARPVAAPTASADPDALPGSVLPPGTVAPGGTAAPAAP